jgi:hypothetical protein
MLLWSLLAPPVHSSVRGVLLCFCLCGQVAEGVVVFCSQVLNKGSGFRVLPEHCRLWTAWPCHSSSSCCWF